MNPLALRHQVLQLLQAEAARPDNDEIVSVALSNPVQAAGPWAVVVTTTDGRTLRLTVSED
ncbi:hypothetical protein ACFC58_06280 [Kitasatospora purpeofusca]|uniref:hypothetical protein n=1 Tax=Kitasatospora purpeofusca TaxID=67352 RepID=UPI0035DEF974